MAMFIGSADCTRIAMDFSWVGGRFVRTYVNFDYF